MIGGENLIIALDAGHGLLTAGKQTPTGIKEWNLNHNVVKYIKEVLKDYDADLIYTDHYEGTIDESLLNRFIEYNDAKADVFVSIHHNAFTGNWNNATGVEVYVDKNPTADDLRLAECIYKRLVSDTGLKGRGIKKENWFVINQNKIPAVLVEGGFMDSKIDYPVIISTQGQKAYAKAVSEGLIEFLNLKKKINTDKNDTFLIKVDNVDKGDVLNIRQEPKVSSKITGTLRYNDPNLYTIVEVSNGWGKLKSGIGWINLYYTKRYN